MPWRQKTFCAYCQYRYFHPIYGYINTESADTHKLVQHEKVWNKEWWEGQQMYPCLFSRTLLSLRNSMCANTVKWPLDLSSYLCTSSHRLTNLHPGVRLSSPEWEKILIGVWQKEHIILFKNTEYAVAAVSCQIQHRIIPHIICFSTLYRLCLN